MSFMQLRRAYQKGWESPNWVNVALWLSLYPQAGLVVNAQRTGFEIFMQKETFRIILRPKEC